MKRKPNSTIDSIPRSWEVENDFNVKSTFKKITDQKMTTETLPKRSPTTLPEGTADARQTESALENHLETSLSADGVESTTVFREQSTVAKTDLNSQLGALSNSLFFTTASGGLTQALQTEKTSSKTSISSKTSADSSLAATGSTSSTSTSVTSVSRTDTSSTQNTTSSGFSTTTATTTTTPPGTTTPVNYLTYFCTNL
jgi:hypothetical protein